MNTVQNFIDPIAPKVLEAYGPAGNRLNFNDIYYNEYVTVQVPRYSGMAKGHTVRVRWVTGRHRHDTETLTIDVPEPQNFKIPRLEVIDAIDSLVTINYSIRTAMGAPLIPSKSLTLEVDPQDFELVEPRLSDDRKRVTVKYFGMTTGYTARVRWHGVITHDTAIKPILNDSSIPFDIPETWVLENRGRSVWINYSIHRSGTSDNLMFSQLLKVTL
ncbi:hypothetical protein [Pseudomonas sp. RT6P73]